MGIYPDKIKAFLLSNPGNYSFKEIDFPQTEKGSVIIKTAAAGICSSDASFIEKGHKALRYPVIPGHEVAGSVFISKNSRFYEGMRVHIAPGLNCGWCDFCSRGQSHRCRNIKILGFNYQGGFSEYIKLPESALDRDILTEIPEDISFEKAILAEPLACCLNVWDNLKPEFINNVLILGGGLLGILHAMTAEIKGIKKICITEPDLSRHEHQSLTRSEYFNETSIPLLKTRTSMKYPEGFDLVIIACKGITVNDSLISLVNTGGTLSLFSGFNKGSRCDADPSRIHYRELTIKGSYGCTTAGCKDALRLLGEGGINAEKLITHRLAFRDIITGFENIRNRNGLKNVIIF